MTDRDTLAQVAEEVGLALAPLAQALESPASFAALMRELGWDLSVIPDPLRSIGVPLSGLIDLLTAGDVGEGGLLDSLAIQEVGRGADQPLPLARSRDRVCGRALG